VGAFESIQAFGAGARWQQPPAGQRGGRRLELPAPNVVLVFP
jgi:hypothetical protein